MGYGVGGRIPWQWLAKQFQHHCQDPLQKKIGIEVERIAIWPDGSPFGYSSVTTGRTPRPGAEKLLLELHKRHGWELVENPQGRPLGLQSPYGKVSLEPGSQLEVSTDPLPNLNRIDEAISSFEERVRAITDPWHLKWLDSGIHPHTSPDDVELIPSPRYHIMDRHFSDLGGLGRHMMRLTSSIQINLDYSSETEAMEMLRVALLLTPVSYSMFANSRIQGSTPLSRRYAIWKQTDPDRTGILGEVFSPNYGFADYAERVWKTPLMFYQVEGGDYAPAHRESLLQLQEKHPQKGALLEANQWNAVRQMFTEVRLKPGYIEVRSVDGQSPNVRYAAAAFWMGVMYSSDARRFVLERLKGLNPRELEIAADEVAEHGGTRLKSYPLEDLTQELLNFSQSELKRRNFGEERYSLFVPRRAIA